MNYFVATPKQAMKHRFELESEKIVCPAKRCRMIARRTKFSDLQDSSVFIMAVIR
jgi:hypothetical protein